ncbi:hypothetical protein [Absidia glauca]|uniref:Metal homeostatis protein bsd2 n=1 Tax=Absidia glauca TaxID=4829 RepID=A0A163IUX1_ABSGL|nr:hypothetical protein [Absidia glauca]
MTRYQQVSTTPGDTEQTSLQNNNNNNNNNHVVTMTQQPAPPQQQQRSDLEDAFGESIDQEDTDDERQQLLTYSQGPPDSAAHPPPSSSHYASPAVLQMTNDGVFANMSAKPESNRLKPDETPPTYDTAVADSTPPYWQTTVITPLGLGDVILVEGLPVGSILAFAWNLLVSASFQFVGFMLTFLLHTSHAAKNGSLAGLGVSLVQMGFYIRSRESLVDDDTGESSGEDQAGDGVDADILSYILMIIGWFLIIRALADYARAKKMEAIIGQEPTPESIV